jgi:hypothetical protein
MLNVKILGSIAPSSLPNLEQQYKDCLLCYENPHQPFLVHLTPLVRNQDGRRLLMNDYFEIAQRAFDNPIYSSPRGNFFFTYEDPRNLAVQATYAVAKVISFCLQKFQYRWPGCLTVDFSEEWEPQHDFPNSLMRLFIGGGIFGLGPYHSLEIFPQPLSPPIVAHEFAHFLFWDLVDRKSLARFVAHLKEHYGDLWLSSRELLESRAVQEGFCDYMAGIVFENPSILPGMPLRDLADESFEVHRLALVPHWRGWSQFLWQVRRRTTQKRRADQIVFLSLSYWDQKLGLQGAAEALKLAAGRLLRNSKSYRKLIDEVAQSTRLLDPPFQEELAWQLSDQTLLVREKGKFFFLSRNGGLIAKGSSKGYVRIHLRGIDPLLVYNVAPDALYLGIAKGKRLLISRPLAWIPQKYETNSAIQLIKEGQQNGSFKLRWICPYEPATLFLFRIQAAKDFISQAEPIPFGHGLSRILWGARYKHIKKDKKERYLELEVPSFWLSKAHLSCLVRAQISGGYIESQPCELSTSAGGAYQHIRSLPAARASL